MAGIFFVRMANGSGSSGLNIEFDENTAGDTLIGAFAAIATTGDFTAPPATLQDSNGNVWTLFYSNINQHSTVADVYNAVALYVCSKCRESGTNDLPIPAALQPADVLASWSSGSEFQSTFAAFTLDNSTYQNNASNNIDITPFDISAPNELVVAFAFDASLVTSGASNVSGLVAFQSLPYGTTTPIDAIGGYMNVNESVPSIILEIASATNVFGFAISMQGSNSTGGSAATTLTFSINKGPAQLVTPKERAMATVQIDCTQQPVTAFPIDYPEWSSNPSLAGFGDPAGVVVAEFDLEHLFQGAGLSEVKTLIAWARPGFNPQSGPPMQRVDDPPQTSPVVAFPAFITNKITLQTILLGSNAQGVNQDQSVAQYLIMPFPGNKNGLKYRFICPQSNAGNPIGKYTLIFCNFDVFGAYDSGGQYAGEIIYPD